MGLCVLYRGDIITKDICCRAHEYKIQFVDWCLTGLKMGIKYQLSIIIPEGNLAKVIR
jgi:tubulin alpha